MSKPAWCEDDFDGDVGFEVGRLHCDGLDDGVSDSIVLAGGVCC